MADLIDRQATLKHIENIRQGVQMMDDTHRASIIMNGMHLCEEAVRNQPSAEPEWNNHTVACLLTELFDDTCACNYNDIDEWLPEKCDFRDTECPKPVGVACWEQFLKHKAERRTDETDD